MNEIIMPHVPEAEKAVIGCLLFDDNSLKIASSFLESKHFWNLPNKLAYETILELKEKGEVIDIVSVKEGLRTKDKWSEYGQEYLKECIDSVAYAEHIEYYSKKVLIAWLEREIINASLRLALDQDIKQLQVIEQMVLKKDNIGAPQMFSYTTSLIDVIESLSQKDTRKCYKTYFYSLDSHFHGLKPGEVNTWGAATNHGKSLMLLNLMHLAAGHGDKCLYVGTEMTATETVGRHLSIATGIEPWKIRKQELNSNDIDRMHNALADKLSIMPIHILDHPEPTLAEIESAIIASQAEVVFLDYLERFSLPKEDNLRLRVKEFMRQLKTMARRRGVIIHLAAQLTRNAYSKLEAMPSLSDLSESSAIEKESDRVILLHRGKEDSDTSKSVIQAIIAKNRHGQRGLAFDLTIHNNDLTITEESNVQTTID